MQGNEIEEEVTEMKAWQDKIRSVVPYTPGEQPNRPNMIKLNTNENPYPPAPGVRKVLNTLDEDKLRLYPDPTAGVLVNALADYYHVGKDQVFTGVATERGFFHLSAGLLSGQRRCDFPESECTDLPL